MALSYYETFPIPEPQAQLDTIAKRVSAQGEALQAVIDGLGSHISERMGTQQSALQTVTSALKRAATKNVKADQKTLDSVIHPIVMNASSAVTRDQVAFQQTLAEQPAAGGTVAFASPTVPLPAGTLTSPPVAVKSIPVSGGVQPAINQQPAPGPISNLPIMPQDCIATDHAAGYYKWFLIDDTYSPVNPVRETLTYAGFQPPDTGIPSQHWEYDSYWPDYASALDAVRGGLGYNIPPCVPDVPVTPPEQPPVQYPPTTGEQWWAICDSLFSNSSVTNNQPDPTVYGPPRYSVSGPYQTSQSAALACPQPPASEPTPEPEPNPLPVQPEPVANPLCPTLTAIPSQWPEPGSEAWCQNAEEIRRWFYNLGRQILDQFKPAFGNSWLEKWGNALEPKEEAVFGPSWIIQKNLITLIRFVISKAADTIQEYTNWLWCLWENVLKAPQCDMTGVALLATCRGVLELFEDIHFGFDIPFLAVSTLKIEIEPLKRQLTYLIEWSCPSKTPSHSEAIDSWSKGLISDDLLKCWLGVHGHSAAVYAPVVAAASAHITPHESIEYGLRTGRSTEEIRALLRRSGVSDTIQQDRMLGLYFELPTKSDFIHWLTRNVFDTEYVQQYDLMEGFDERYWATFGDELTAAGISRRYAEFDYAAHWINPAEGKLAELLHRLRPGEVADAVAFAPVDYLRLLAEQDVAPYFRDRLLATAYSPYTRSDLRELYNFRVITTDDYGKGLMDLGYDSVHAKSLLEADTRQVNRQRSAQSHGYTPSRVAKLYPLGVLDDRTIDTALSSQGFAGDEISRLKQVAVAEYQANILRAGLMRQLRTTVTTTLSAFESGAVSSSEAILALEALGVPARIGQSLLAAQELQVRARLVTRIVAATRRSYLNGVINDQEALTTLQASGITPERSVQYLAEYNAEKTIDRQRISTERVIRLVRKGLLPIIQARVRLTNLGWTNPDQVLLLAEVQQDIRNQEQKVAAAQQKQGRQQAKQLEAVLKQNKAAEQKVVAQIRKASPIGKLQTWYAKHLVTEAYFRGRMELMQYPPESIEEFFAEAQLKRQEYDAKQAKKVATNGAPAGG